MYLLCMIKARIRWCTCRVENILTLGKLISLWFCFLLHCTLFLISQTSYLTFKIILSYELARPVMGTIFLVNIYHVKSRLNTPLWGSLLSPNNVNECLMIGSVLFEHTEKPIFLFLLKNY